MKKGYFIFVLIFFTGLVNSCINDTCNGVLGNTFSTVEVDSISDGLPDTMNIYLYVEALADLPENYFSDAYPADSITEAQVNEMDFTLPILSLSLLDDILPDSNETESYMFTYAFGDRKSYIDCQHPGSSDTYFLELYFSIENSENEYYDIVEFDWEQIFAAGHL